MAGANQSSAAQQSAAYLPQFNFGSNSGPAGERTATIKELLSELNRERTDDSGSTYDIKSLGTVLRFLSSITGKNYRSITRSHPLSTLKTIKLLHNQSRHIDAHLIKLLEYPKGNSHGTMDFLTMPASPEGEGVKRKIEHIIAELQSVL